MSVVWAPGMCRLQFEDCLKSPRGTGELVEKFKELLKES